jgi:hypothetical protein
MDWYKKYKFKSYRQGWNYEFEFFDKRLDVPEFKIECDVTEEEFIKNNQKSFKLFYGDDFENVWHINNDCIILAVVEIRKEKLNKLDGLV